MSEHLNALDATFLELEELDESAHMHIGAILVFDPQSDGGSPPHEAVCEHLSERLGRLPRYRQRLSARHTGGLSWPEWLDDPSFEVRKHVGRAALPTPGGERELNEWASVFFSQRLDRRRPLWEMVLVEGLAGGRWALATKTHHCMVDGIGSMDVGHLLLDVAPTPSRGFSRADDGIHNRARLGTDGAQTRATPSAASADPLRALARVWSGLVPGERLLHAAQLGVHTALHPRAALRTAASAAAMIVREELHAAPHTSLNEPIGTRRRFEVVSVSLEDLKQIKRALGGTVNDVALTIAASGLRALLAGRGERLPSEGLRAMVPMNVRLASEHLALGNRISSLFIELPVAQGDAVARYIETVARTKAAKADERQAAGTTAVIELSGLAPPALHSAIARALYATRLFNVTITNVPGPQQELYALGAPLREIHPLVPLAAEHAVGVALVSYNGSVFFGVVADPDAVPELDVALDAMRDSVAELLAAAEAEPVAHANLAASTARVG